jgi:hypothetical protein
MTRCALAVSGTAITIWLLGLNQGQSSKSDSDEKSSFHHSEPAKGLNTDMFFGRHLPTNASSGG